MTTGAKAPTDGKGGSIPIARIAAVGAFALVLVLIAVLLLRDGGGHGYSLLFQNAGQLVKGDDVQVGGRRVGSIEAIELTNDNQARVKVKVERPFAPLHYGTRAVIRATSLSGIANRYVALMPGPNNLPKLDDGATLKGDSTTTPVDLDQLFNTFDGPTRRHLQEVIQGSATQYAGRGRQANEAARYFNPAISTTSGLIAEVNRDQDRLTDFIVDSSKLVTALAERRDALSSLVSNANATASAIAQENAAFGRSLDLLPETLRKANTTFVNLRSTLDDLDVLVAASKPATRRLAPFLRELRPLVAEARPTIRDLRRLVTEAGPNNDLADAVAKLPRLQRIASPTFQHTITALQRSQHVLEFARPYTPDFVGFLRDFGQGTANYDANGHFARVMPVFNAYSVAGGSLTPIPPSARFDGLQTGNLKRCPGAASQAAADGSAPFRDSPSIDCDPSLVLPGP